METEAIRVGVVMQRRRIDNRWQSHQWRLLDVMIDPPQDAAAKCLRSDDDDTRWLFGSFDVRLYTDEAEGYFLNVSSSAPCWFVMSRQEETAHGDLPVPKAVTLSYNEAARLMDGGEQVETVVAPAAIVDWMRAFVAEHYQPEVKKKRRKPSFEGGAAVDAMAKAETGDRSNHGGQ